MTGWRPEGWVNPYPITARYDDPRYIDRVAHESFEVGANAMLEALKKDPSALFGRGHDVEKYYKDNEET